MTSNKHKRSTPHKSPQKQSPHKPHKLQKSHKSSQEKVKPLTSNSSNSPILPPKCVKATQPILPPTRRILFPQNSKQSNSQEPFFSLSPVKKYPSKTGKHALSSPATNPLDDRPSKKQCFSSHSPAKYKKLVSVELDAVNWRGVMSKSSDEEDQEGTSSPPSQKRKADIIASAVGRHKKPAISVAALPKAAVSDVIPLKQNTPSVSTFQPNSTAINKIDFTVLRLEKEELQKHLDTSIQQTQLAKNEVKKWESKYRATIGTQETLNRLLNAEMKEKDTLQNRLDTFTQKAHELKLAAKTWEEKWKTTNEENNSVRKQLASKTKGHNKSEFHTEHQQTKHHLQIAQNAKLQHELKSKQFKNHTEKEPHQLTTKITQLEQELSHLKSQNGKMGHTKEEREKYLEATNKLLAKQVAQLKGEIQRLQDESKSDEQKQKQKQQQNTKIQEHPIPPKSPETSSKHHHLQEKISHLTTQLATSQQNLQNTQQELQEQNTEIDILISEHESRIKELKAEIRRLEGLNRWKDLGLERMGLLVTGWALKWRGVEMGLGRDVRGDVEMGMGGRRERYRVRRERYRVWREWGFVLMG